MYLPADIIILNSSEKKGKQIKKLILKLNKNFNILKRCMLYRNKKFRWRNKLKIKISS